MPPICEAINKNVPPGGGWMYSSLKKLREYSDDKYAIATVYEGKEFIQKEIDSITYYLLPLNGRSRTKYNKDLEEYWKTIKSSFVPDIVHIHGSEFPYGLAYVRACGSEGVVVSIQGIISCYARYYAAGIDFRSVNNCYNFNSLLRAINTYKGQQSFIKRGELEKELLKRVKHIIGRTDWDKAHSWAINPEAEYHYCGETLRDAFYRHKWNYSDCEPHSIFVSQAVYPIKGLHILLKALPLILTKFPDTMVYVAGADPRSTSALSLGGYGFYIKDLINCLGIEAHVQFTGLLNEDAMCQRYLQSNVFVCCSAIENSPNSLGEAQLLEMPYVASFVGGVPEIVAWNHDVLYRFEEFEMLAEKIVRIFNYGEKFTTFQFDKKRYDSEINANRLLDIYQAILN